MLLESMLASPACRKLSSLAESSHGIYAIVRSVLSLVKGLATFSRKPEFDHDALVRDALMQINNLLHVLWQYRGNTERCARIHDLIVEELHLILATVKPYGRKSSYPSIVANIHDQRVPTLCCA